MKTKGTRQAVMRGFRHQTTGGLTKSNMKKNRHGKIVSIKLSAFAKCKFHKSPLKAWVDAVKSARIALGIVGFVAVGGKSAEGRALYEKAKALMEGAHVRPRMG